MFLEVNRIKKNFRSVPGHTNYYQAKRLCQTKHHSAAFLANKPRHELLGIWKKRKTFCTRGTIRENEELSPARQSIAGKHHIHSKYVPW